MLSALLREADGAALLGDLAEEHSRRVSGGSHGEAARWYRRELYASLAAVLWLRGVECIRAGPWGIVAAAYTGVGLYEFAAVWLLSLTWPDVAQWTSARRLVIEFPGLVAIAYVAATFRRSAAFVLAGAMLCVASFLNDITNETISTAFLIASVVVGPLAAVLGGLLRRAPTTVASAGLAFMVMSVAMSAQQPTSAVDESKTIYGEKSARAPRELDAFAFLIGTWKGTGRSRLPDGKYAEYPMGWVGRYILDGTAIADEGHGVFPDGKPALGITFRQYDAARATWVIEFLNLDASFLRRQVRIGVGSVIVNEKNVTVVSGGPGIAIREHYLVRDRDHWVYRMDVSNDDGKTWNESSIEFTFQRSQ
jgi:uncharacterized membrane protein YjjB (DUF3815 family)